jgi:hypothetical protein
MGNHAAGYIKIEWFRRKKEKCNCYQRRAIDLSQWRNRPWAVVSGLTD